MDKTVLEVDKTSNTEETSTGEGVQHNEKDPDKAQRQVSSHEDTADNNDDVDMKGTDKTLLGMYSNNDIIHAKVKDVKDMEHQLSPKISSNLDDEPGDVYTHGHVSREPPKEATTDVLDTAPGSCTREHNEEECHHQGLGKLSVMNNFDVITEVSEESYEAEDNDKKSVVYTDMTERFSEASIRLEEKFECGYCASRSVIGRCDQCIEYFCQKCLTRHDRFTVSGTHDVFLFRCAESLKVNKVVRAVGYCQMCRVYLCDECVLHHQGFKKFRDHMIVKGTEMPVVRPKPDPKKRRQVKNMAASTSKNAIKSRSTQRLSDFSVINPMYQREPKLLWSEKKGYFFKWFQY